MPELRPSFVVPIRKDLLAYTDARSAVQPQTINEAEKSATFVISTPSLDRDGEIMHPGGCWKRIESYRKNPIVLYDHEGMGIGLCESPQGKFGLRMDGGNLVGTVWFHCKTRESRDVWELVKSGCIRMASVGFIPHAFRPLESRVFRPDGKGSIKSRSGTEYTEWEITEWSITPIGANQEALRHDLKRMSVVIQKSFAAAATMQATTERTIPMKTKFAKLAFSKRQAAAAFKRSGGDPALYRIGETAKAWTFTLKKKEGEDDEPKPKEDEAAKPDEKPVEKDEKPKEDDKPAEDGSQKPGAQVLKDLHNHHAGLSDYADSMASTNEHPGVLKMLGEHGEHAKEMMEACKSAAAEHYPDLDFEKFCKSETEEKPADDKPEEASADDADALDEFDDEPAEESEDDKAKRLKAAVTKKYRMKSEHASAVKDASEFLGDMSARDEIPKTFRSGCKLHAGELTKMLEGNGDTDREGELAAKAEDEEDAAMEKALQDSLLIFKSAKTA